MQINEFVKANAERSVKLFPTCKDWTLSDWGVALAGEAGELCNWIKKYNRFDEDEIPAEEMLPHLEKEMAKELADVMTYVCLMANKLDIDLEKECIDKFNEVSDRFGCDIKIGINDESSN